MFKLARRNRWTGWTARKPSLLRPFPTLGLEQLEVRDTPATFTWTGGATDGNWSSRGNWQGGVAPTGNPANVEDLVFPGGAARLTATNDIPAGVFNSITYGASGYTLNGLALTLGGIAGVSQSGALVVTAGAVNNVLGMNVALGAQAGNFQTFSILSSAELTISGRLSGVLNSTLTKDGPGSLVLAGDNGGFSGFIRLNNNAGQLVAAHPNALGSSTARTTVGSGASLRVRDVVGTINEPVTLNGLGVSNDGALSVLSGSTTWGGAVVLDSDAALGGLAGGVLTVTGVVSDSGAGFNLYKKGAGEVQLASPTGNTYRRLTVVDDGVLTASHPKALGADGTVGSGTVVNANLTAAGQLRLAAPSGTPGFTIRDEFLTVNGPGREGLANRGALQNTAGNNFWAGPVTLGSPLPNSNVAAAVGAADKTSLTISGVVASPNGPFALVKVDAGRVVLDNRNTYTGTTLVAEGALTVRDSLALGTFAGATGAEVQAVQVIGSPGTFSVSFRFGNAVATTAALPFDATALQVEAALNALTTVATNGGRVAVTKTAITGGSQFNIVFGGAFVGQDLFQVSAGSTDSVAARTITVRDGGESATAVIQGASLELEVEAAKPTNPQTDARGRDLGADSVTGDPNRLQVSEPLTIFGRGLDAADNGRTGGTGALRSVSGINRYTAPIQLGFATNVADAVGVDRDERAGHPTPDASYFTSDYSLTTTSAISGRVETDFVKRGAGHLILPVANSYLGTTRVEEGWVTVQDVGSLGARYTQAVEAAPAANVVPIGQGNTAQPPTVVSAGAAVHVRPLVPGRALTFAENLTLAGIGPAHPYTFIDRRGALMNLDGNTSWSGDIGLVGQAGIGVEQVIPGSPSNLVVTGTLRGGRNTYNLDANGGQAEQSFVIETGAPAGLVRVKYNFFNVPDRLSAYYPPRGEAGSARVFDTGVINGTRTVEFPFGPGASTRVELVMNEGGNTNPGTVWELSAETEVDGGLVKFGSKRLNLQGEGTYGGVTEVREGTLRAQNDTALGRKFSGTATTQGSYTQTDTVVSRAAVLELAGSVGGLAGGVVAGVQVYQERLVLNAPGQQVMVAGSTAPGFTGTFTLSYRGVATGPLPITVPATDPANPTDPTKSLQAALNALPTVQADFGPAGVTVARAGNVFTVTFGNTLAASAPLLVAAAAGGAEVAVSGGPAGLVGVNEDNAWRGPVSLQGGARVDVRVRSRVSLFGPIDDAGVPAPGSDLVKRGPGELLLAGANTYRGTTGIDEGVVTAANSAAFGATAGGTRVAEGAQLQLQGNLAVAGEALTVRGSGPATATAFEDTVRWLNVGPATTNNGRAGAGLPTSGRVTSVAADPSDPQTIYAAAAGGGAWKTTDGGVTWNPLFDLDPDGNGLITGGSFAVSQSDPRVVYFASGEANGYPTAPGNQGGPTNYAGTGVYKSTDAGRTWQVLLSRGGANPLRGQAVSKIIVDPEVPDRVYVASGTSNLLNADPNAVPGVWRHDGQTWFNLTGSPSPNRLATPGQDIYQAAPQGLGPPENAGPDDDYRMAFPQAAATWSDILLLKRGDEFAGTSEWVLYAALGESTQRYYGGWAFPAVMNAVYRTENPDVATGAPTWWIGNGTIFPRATTAGPDITQLGVALPTLPDRRQNPFPFGTIVPPIPYIPPGRNGWTKLAGTQDNYVQPAPVWGLTADPSTGITNYYRYGVVNAHITVYASVAWPDYQDQRGGLRDVQRTGWDGGIATQWQAIANAPNLPFGQPTHDDPLNPPTGDPTQVHYRNIVKGTGRYNQVLQVQAATPYAAAANNPRVVYLGGQTDIFTTADGGANAWTTLGAGAGGRKPAEQYHALSVDTTGRLLIGNDGGVWRYDPTAPAADRGYVNLNGDLTITQLNSADPHPTDLNQAVAGSADNGTQRYTGGLAWDRVDDAAGADAGVVRYDPLNPLVVYAVRDGLLRKSLDGGITWTTLRAVSTAPPNLNRRDALDPYYGGAPAVAVPVGPANNPTRLDQYPRNDGTSYFPLVVDQVNPARLLIGNERPVAVLDAGGNLVDVISNNLYESTDGGLSFNNLNAGITVSAIGQASFQGPFRADPEANVLGVSPPGFPNVLDKGSNTYDPDTVYVAGYYQDGGAAQANRREELRVTKDRGVSWVVRTPPGASATDPAPITDITVDPSNRDVVYVTRSRRAGQAGGRVYRSTDAGRTWADVTGPDPDMQAPAYVTAVDPRDGSVYLGNETGVWVVRNAAESASFIWTKLGAGLPRAAVRDLVLNQTLNTLTAATNGRGMFQLLLTDYQPAAGAVRAVSGASVWTGAVTLTGPTTIAAAGSQALQNGITAASLNLIGQVGDDTDSPKPRYELRKVGLGTVTLSGANTYSGQTLVQEGVLQVNNPKALGVADLAGNTVVSAGAALELRSDLEAEPVTVNGRGFAFNGRFTGALRNVSGINTYTGPLTLATDTTIGVDSGTSLTVGRKPDVLAGTGSITDGPDSRALDKELPGTLILAEANSYDGVTRVAQGAVQVQHARALGSTGAAGPFDTRVSDGAQLQIARNAVTGLPTVVEGERLYLSGSGIDKTGALLNVHPDGNPAGATNAWQGPVTFNIDPSVNPPTTPSSQVSIGVSDPADELVIDGPVGQVAGQASFGLVKVGPGRLTLAQANGYTGVTNVDAGTLAVQNNAALGPRVSSEVQTVAVAGTVDPATGKSYQFDLSFNGESTGLLDASTVTATVVRSKLGALPSVGGTANLLVNEVPSVNGKTFTVTFQGTLANVDQPALVAGNVSAGLSVNITEAQKGGAGTVVAAGATLELDGDAAGGLLVDEVLNLNGDGVGLDGALRNATGANTYTGPITLDTDASIGAAAGTVLTIGETVGGKGFIRDPAGAAAPARFRKAGAGTVALQNPNPYAGRTEVAAGVLRALNPGALGGGAPEQQVVQVTGSAGNFVLTFDGDSTDPAVPAGATAQDVEDALNALDGIGAGGVSVTRDGSAGNYFYTITFDGPNLAGRNVPQLTGFGTVALNVFFPETREGPEGTVVNSGATLQVAGGLTFNREAVTINGPGFNNQGALNNFAGNNVWAAPLTLGSNASVGTTTALQTLSVAAPVTDNKASPGLGLDIVGPGTVSYDASADNDYTGTTNVRAGTLRLNSAGIAVKGPLTVGDGPAPAAVRYGANRDDQIADAAPVAVGPVGTFDLNGRADTIGTLAVTNGLVLTGAGGRLGTSDVTMNGGTIAVGAGGDLSARDLRMTGGLVTVGAAGSPAATAAVRNLNTAGGAIDVVTAASKLTLTGDVTATSLAAAPARIAGPGELNLGGAERTFIVTRPAVTQQPEDLRVSAFPTNGSLVKDGDGRMTLFPGGATTVPVRILAGDLQADTNVGPKVLAGPAATLSGVGSVDSVGGAGGPAVGTVNPGQNWRVNPAGILTVTGDVTWGPGTTFAVDLDASSHPTPPAGADYDQLRVTGAVVLGGAKLDGTFGPGVLLGDRFTVIRADGGVTGKFKGVSADPNFPNRQDVVFIQGQKFRVVYPDPVGTPGSPNTTDVILEKVKADVLVAVAASRNPSTLREPVAFTATVTPEPDAGSVPTADTVTFTVDGRTYGPFNVRADGTVELSSALVPGGFLTGGAHTVTATFNGDALNFNAGTSPALTQTVEVPEIAPLAGDQTLISPQTSRGTQDTITATTTVRNERSQTGWTVVVKDAAGNTVRTFAPAAPVPQKPSPGADNSFAVSVTWDGRNQAGTFVGDGDYTLTATFLDVWGNTASAAPITVRVDNTLPTTTPVTSPVPVIAPAPNIPPGALSQVPTTTTLTGTVGDDNLDFYTVTVKNSANAVVRTFTGAAGATDVSATWDGRDGAGNVVPDGVYTLVVTVRDRAGNTSSPAAPASVIVLNQPPAVALATNGPTTYGQSITLTATVTQPFQSLRTSLADDEVRFFDGATLLGTGTLALVDGEYRASLTVPTFNAGTYTSLTVGYPGTTIFLPAASAPTTHVVNPAVLTVTADDQTKQYGGPVPPLTYRVSGLVNNDTEAVVVSGALATPATERSDVGAYPILQGTLSTNPNYVVSYTQGTLTVTPAPLTVRIDNATRVFNRVNPPFTATYEGLLLGDTPAVVGNLVLTSPAGQSSKVGSYPIVAQGTPRARNYTITVVPGVLTVTPIPSEIAVGAGPGSAQVRRYDPDGKPFGTLNPFPGFTGGVRTATADFNRDGIEDVAVATGPGAARVVVVDGNTDEVLFSGFPFEGFTGGVFVTAGDVTGDGRADLIVTPDEGGGPRVQVYRGGDFAPVVSFFGIQDLNFRGGARAAVGDLNADGFADLVVSAGFGGGPRVAVWDGKSLANLEYRPLTADFFAFDTSLRNGVYVAVGDLDGDGFGDLIAGAGPGGGPRVTTFSGRLMLQQGAAAAVGAPIANFFAGNTANRGGIRVAAENLDGDLRADLVVGDGDAAGSHVTAYLGKSFVNGVAPEYFGFDAYPGFLGGVFVG